MTVPKTKSYKTDLPSWKSSFSVSCSNAKSEILAIGTAWNSYSFYLLNNILIENKTEFLLIQVFNLLLLLPNLFPPLNSLITIFMGLIITALVDRSYGVWHHSLQGQFIQIDDGVQPFDWQKNSNRMTPLDSKRFWWKLQKHFGHAFCELFMLGKRCSIGWIKLGSVAKSFYRTNVLSLSYPALVKYLKVLTQSL